MFTVRVAIAGNGERIPLLVEAQNGLPVIAPNQYILLNRRPRCETATLEKELRHISMLYAWATASDIDLAERLSSGKGLAPDEVRNLVDVSRVDLREPKEPREALKSIVTPVVANPTCASRLYVMRDYIAWNLDQVISRTEIGTMRYEHLRERRERVISAISSCIPDGKSADVEGLSPQLRERLWELIRPESPENPWQVGLRYRNRLIIEFMSRLGPRKGDLLKIRTSGVNTGVRPQVHIPRERDSTDDERRHEPRPKTLARTIPLGEALRAIADDYLLKERALIPGARRRPYLILGRDGRPLSLSGLRDVVKQITCRHPEFKGLLKPHVLRHTAADLWWAELQKRSDLDDRSRKEVLNYLMGWCEESNQGEKYPRGEIVRTAQEFALKAQAEFLCGRQ